MQTRRTCRCGHDRRHPAVSGEPSYSVLGWLGVFMGATMRPAIVRFRCSSCDAVFDESTDPKELEAHA
ncbi:MAG: hypothetical protein QM765_48720 [Myxococcales bacterium]